MALTGLRAGDGTKRRARTGRTRTGRAWIGACMAVMASVALVAALPAPAAAQQAPVPFSTWLASLQAAGYTVTQGTSALFDLTYCQSSFFPIFRSCLGTSNTNPYLVIQPPVGAQYQNPYYASAAIATAPSGQVSDAFYQLGPSEAIITVVNMPPQAAYFSLQTNMFTRPIIDYTDWHYTKSPDASRALVFGTTANSVNNVDIFAADSQITWGSGAFAVITTANQTLLTALKASFPTGYNPAALFADGVGPNTNIGLGAPYDDFMTILRYSLPEDPSAGSAWSANIANNVLVYRIDAPAGTSFTPVADQEILTKLCGQDEVNATSCPSGAHPHVATQAELVSLLRTWLTNQEGHATSVVAALSSEKVNKQGGVFGGLAGPFCISAGTFCTGDEQDTDAYKIAVVGAVEGTDLAIMVGVNHTLTDNATYLSAAVEDQVNDVRVANQSQSASSAGFTSGTMTGSASQMLMDLGLYSQASPALIADLPNLYAVMFTRNCPLTNVWCTRTYTSLLPSTPGRPTDKLDMVERAYVLPTYSNGANPIYLENPEIIH